MKTDAMTDDQYGMLFGVRRSIRYHEQRAAFFEVLHRVTGALTILLAGSVLYDIARPGNSPAWLLALAALAAILAAFDFVIGYARSGALHRTLKSRFGELEIAILCGDDADETWQKHWAERLRIEQDEPAVYRALDLACHNELLPVEGHGQGSDHRRTIKPWQYATRHFLHWPDVAA